MSINGGELYVFSVDIEGAAAAAFMSWALLDCQRTFGDNPCCEIEVGCWNINSFFFSLFLLLKVGNQGRWNEEKKKRN